jgi:hypothetical protein
MNFDVKYFMVSKSTYLLLFGKSFVIHVIKLYNWIKEFQKKTPTINFAGVSIHKILFSNNE